jgi:RNA polymerase sigma-70 factor (ECF subfamily)
MVSAAKWKCSMKNDGEVENIPALVEDAKDNPIAFGRLYDIYVQPVYRYLYSRVGTTHDAEDLTSQTFMSAFEHLPHYHENGQFAAWLFRIARNKMTDHFRRNRYEVELETAERFVTGGDAIIQVIQDEEINCLKALIMDLNPEEQDLIRLRYVADLTFAEMANLLGKREEAVKQSVYRLLARLKSQIGVSHE